LHVSARLPRLHLSKELRQPADHGRSQDFVWGCTFLCQKKLTTFFNRRLQNTHSNCLNILSHRPDLPNFLQNCTLALPRGCTLCLWGALTTFPCKFGPTFFFSWGCTWAPSAPPGYAYAADNEFLSLSCDFTHNTSVHHYQHLPSLILSSSSYPQILSSIVLLPFHLPD